MHTNRVTPHRGGAASTREASAPTLRTLATQAGYVAPGKFRNATFLNLQDRNVALLSPASPRLASLRRRLPGSAFGLNLRADSRASAEEGEAGCRGAQGAAFAAAGRDAAGA
jgi:hypothetical protein